VAITSQVSQSTAEGLARSGAEPFATIGDPVEVFASEAGSCREAVDARGLSGIAKAGRGVSDQPQAPEDLFVG
jgi:hypothetical protein